MRGIRLRHGVCFVEYGGVTVRIKADGTCGLSPITLPALEWDLRCEPPEAWDYIGDADIDALGEDIREQLERIAEKYRSLFED